MKECTKKRENFPEKKLTTATSEDPGGTACETLGQGPMLINK